jgi:hypothetical protein
LGSKPLISAASPDGVAAKTAIRLVQLKRHISQIAVVHVIKGPCDLSIYLALERDSSAKLRRNFMGAKTTDTKVGGQASKIINLA